MGPNVEYILNANPAKKLRIQYSKLKENYTEEAARSYKELYDGKPLSFLLENARFIFSEAYYGCQFFLSTVVEGGTAITFTELPKVLDVIHDYVQENSSSMGAVQRKMFEHLESVVEAKVRSAHKVTMVLENAFSKDIFAKHAYDAVVKEVFESGTAECFADVQNPVVFYALAPFVAKMTSPAYVESPEKFMHPVTEGTSVNMDAWKTYAESIVSVKELYGSDIYKEAVASLPKMTRIFFDSLASESIRKQMESIYTMNAVPVTTEASFNALPFDTFYSTPQGAINRIFQNEDVAQYALESVQEVRAIRDEMADVLLNTVFEYAAASCFSSDNPMTEMTSFADIFAKPMTVEDALYHLCEAVGTPGKTVAALAHSSLREDKPAKPENTNGVKRSSGRPLPPKSKGVLNKITVKAMDAERKEMAALGKAKEGLETLGNAGKAVVALPKNVGDMIADIGREWKEADEEKRKQKILEPGYRSKVFRNVKTALTYGSVAAVNFALIPWMAIFHHHSKTKDARIRRDLIHELDTEIKVCEEKISDAASAGDQKQKYQLMRIKAKLEQESLRVKANSKSI